MVLAQVSVSFDQRCPTVAKASGNILFRSPTHAQPTGKGMPQGVPVRILALLLNSNRLIARFSLKSSLLQGRDIHTIIEVFGMHRRPLGLAWEDPLGILPRTKSFQNFDGFLVQVNILASTGFGLGQRDNSTFQVNISPFQSELLFLPKTRQNGKSYPWDVDWYNRFQQSVYFFMDQSPYPSFGQLGHFYLGKWVWFRLQ